MGMDTVDKLNRVLVSQDFVTGLPYAQVLERYRRVAAGYAETENSVAVLSDLRARVSYIYYGGFARVLGVGGGMSDCRVSSIWEDDIFRLVHPEDLAGKHLQELRFFDYVKGLPLHERADYYLMSRLRMMTVSGCYVPVVHRMYYIQLPSNGTVWLALCLYNPCVFEMPSKCVVVNSVNGQSRELDDGSGKNILSARERQVLGLVDKGLTSKDIAEMLSISKNTVSRHRQQILGKLQVSNSVEACKVGKELELI